MAAPSELTNYSKVLRCVEYRLKQINHANGYYTNGIWVNLGGDLTLLNGNWPHDWRHDLAAAFIVPGDDARISAISAPARKAHEYFIYCARELKEQERQTRNLVDLRAEMADDIERALRADYKLNEAAAALGFPARASDGMRVSCIDHHVKQVVHDGMIWPRINFMMIMEFQDIVTIPVGLPTG